MLLKRGHVPVPPDRPALCDSAVITSSSRYRIRGGQSRGGETPRERLSFFKHFSTAEDLLSYAVVGCALNCGLFIKRQEYSHISATDFLF